MNAVDFEVHAGELRSVIGPNGAGKSTFFKLIAGELPPSSGRVVFDGRDVTGLPQFARSQRGIAKSYQVTTIFPHLTVWENVRVAAQCRQSVMNCWTRADRLPSLAHVVLDLIRELDRGNPLGGFRLARHLRQFAAARGALPLDLREFMPNFHDRKCGLRTRTMTRLRRAFRRRGRVARGNDRVPKDLRASLLEILEAVDGPIRGQSSFDRDETDGPLNKRLDQICNQAAAQIRKQLQKVRISDLASKS